MNALIVGLGSIGRRHLANLQHMEPDISITVWHQHSTPSGHRAPLEAGPREVFRLEDAVASRPRFAIISGPASAHVDTAMDLAAHDVHLLIEKPLSTQLDGVDLLLDRCRERGLALLVGYNYRFYEPLQTMRSAITSGHIGKVLAVRAEVGQYLPDWRPGVDYRQGVTARRELGGGVLLELSHEIDYVRWLVGEISEVSARIARVSDLEIDVEDVAEVTVTFANGAIGSVHLDMIQRIPTRTCKIIGSEGTLVWDGITHQLSSRLSSSSSWTDLCPAAARDRNETYVAEVRHFLNCVRGGATPMATGEDGRRVLEIVLAARQSAAESRVVPV